MVSWDHRGHGDSDHAALYSWEADLRDAVAVLESTSTAPLPLVGHSKGGGLLLDIALFFPERVTRLVSLDGLPSTRRRGRRDLSQEERVQGRAEMLERWLDHRRRAHDVRRKPGTIEELARRRGEMNPRLPFEWLCYLVTAGARQDVDGWRWKLDPALRMGGFGPWRPGWILAQLASLAVPTLGLVSRVVEPMGWGSSADELRAHLAPRTVVEDVEDLGHFLHIEAPAPHRESGARFPARAAGMTSARRLTHGRVELALWSLREGSAGQRPLLLLHELGGAPRTPRRPRSPAGRGRSGRSTSPATAARRCRPGAATPPRS